MLEFGTFNQLYVAGRTPSTISQDITGLLLAGAGLPPMEFAGAGPEEGGGE